MAGVFYLYCVYIYIIEAGKRRCWVASQRRSGAGWSCCCISIQPAWADRESAQCSLAVRSVAWCFYTFKLNTCCSAWGFKCIWPQSIFVSAFNSLVDINRRAAQKHNKKTLSLFFSPLRRKLLTVDHLANRLPVSRFILQFASWKVTSAPHLPLFFLSGACFRMTVCLWEPSPVAAAVQAGSVRVGLLSPRCSAIALLSLQNSGAPAGDVLNEASSPRKCY